MITIKSKNTKVLTSSAVTNANNTGIVYQANTDLYVEGNTYPDLITQKTIFDLECAFVDMANIDAITQTQIDNYIAVNYPPIP